MKIKYKKPNEDLAGIKLGDKRLEDRLQKTVEAMSENPGDSILSVCGTRYDAKAFYALLTNEKFSFEKITEASRRATVERIKSSGVTEVLLPQDTTDVNLNGHKKTEGLGYSSNHTKGVQVHSCLALTPDGSTLGLMSQQYDTRKLSKQKETKWELSKRPIEEKESYRWLSTTQETLKEIPEGITPIIICDREGDFYELYADMLSLNTSFIVRLSQERVSTEGEHCIKKLRYTAACGEVEISVPRNTRQNIPARTAKMEIAHCCVTIVKPKRIKAEIAEELTLNLVRITEVGEVDEPIEWLLATNMPLTTSEDVMKVVEYYMHRWKIERFHYILKSGCQVERIQQRTYERILPVLFIYSMIAAFILAITYFARSLPDAPCSLFLDEEEWKILHRLITRDENPPDEPYSLKTAVAFLGELGGFKHNPSDGDYGVKAIWRGLIKLFDALDILHRLMGQV
jgi:hypothetical protein